MREHNEIVDFGAVAVLINVDCRLLGTQREKYAAVKLARPGIVAFDVVGRSVIPTALERLVFNECRSVGSNAVAVGFGTSRAAAACQPDHCRACERDKQHLHRLR